MVCAQIESSAPSEDHSVRLRPCLRALMVNPPGGVAPRQRYHHQITNRVVAPQIISRYHVADIYRAGPDRLQPVSSSRYRPPAPRSPGRPPDQG